MGLLSALTCGLLLAVGTVMAQMDVRNTSERLLPQWLTGIIAVTCFLILTFIGFLVKKMWCDKSNGKMNSGDSGTMEDNEISTRNDLSLEDLRKKRNTKAKENEYASGSTYDTKLDVIRGNNSVEVERENEYEMEDTYDTNMSIIRKSNRVEAKEEEDPSMYATSLDYRRSKRVEAKEEEDPNSMYATSMDFRTGDNRNAYENQAMDRSEDKATPM
ncbi:PDZK1-interacting protein 1 [Cololabis saira]|uniref:PDZK1-interacting protein 1 n=1 Tax=Cololabis saira TaxID=129043 RepID=UPI002AD22EE5|nr:PDZK1-interacting protein 1 [Cololabis saira]